MVAVALRERKGADALARINDLYSVASAELAPDEIRVAAIEAEVRLSSRFDFLFTSDPYWPKRFLALTNRRLISLRLGNFTGKLLNLDFAEPMLSFRALGIEIPRQPRRRGYMEIRKANGKVLMIRFESRWFDQAKTLFMRLPRGGAGS